MDFFRLQRFHQPLPWEMGPSRRYPGIPKASVIRGDIPLTGELGRAALAEARAQRIEGEDALTSAPIRRGLRLRLASGPIAGTADANDRSRTITRWCEVLKVIGDCGAFRPRVRDYRLFAEEVLEGKATATIHSRSCSWGLYLKWTGVVGVAPFPIVAENIEEYLRHAKQVAPTRGTKFLEATAFLGHLFKVDVEAAFTPRARGIALGGLKRKRETVKRDPFPASLIMRWERELEADALNENLTDEELVKATFKGFILWTTHARLRFGDAARINKEPTSDILEGEGFLETGAGYGRYKTGYDPRKAGRILPAVSVAKGVSGVVWTTSWMELRRRAGLRADVDDTLMPEVLAGWKLGDNRMTTTAGQTLLRDLLRDAGVNPSTFGTHSAKATVLSWLAKAG
jgi:hypothetical protein